MGFFDLDDTYDDQFKVAYELTKRSLTGNTEVDIKTLETTVETLFDFQGLDWTGRGEIFLAKNQATIAATQAILSEIEAETK